MATAFKASSQQLFRAVGYPENVRRNSIGDDEPYHIWMAVNALSNSIWELLGEEKYHREFWPIDAKTMDILRAALNDNRANYAAKSIAQALVRGRCTEPEVMACLDGWDRLVFIWLENAMTAELIAEAMQRSGLVRSGAVNAQALRDFLVNPLTAIDNSWEIVGALFGDSMVYAALKGSDVAEHHEFLRDLCSMAVPLVEIEELKQLITVPERLVPMPSQEYPQQQAMVDVTPVYVDAAEFFIVSFMHQGKYHCFTTKNGGRWMDPESVMRYFDQFMVELGRKERVFDLQVALGGEDAGYIVAAPEAVLRLATELHLPLRGTARNPAHEDFYSAPRYFYADGSPILCGDAVLFDHGRFPGLVTGFLERIDHSDTLNAYTVLVNTGNPIPRLTGGIDAPNGKIYPELQFVERNSKDYVRAGIDWLTRRASAGDASAQFSLGNLHIIGHSVPQDYAQGIAWWLKSSKQDYALAQYQLGSLYFGGEGLPVDKAEARRWWRKAAELGYAPAQFNIGIAYANGLGVEQDDEQALAWFLKAAAQGHAGAQTNLGVAYAKGKGVPLDKAQAFQWYLKAAQQEYTQAQYNLGFCFQEGNGVARDHKQAVQWYYKAALQGHAAAQCNLADKYEHGLGIQRTYSLALEWYHKAAAQGVARAMYRLGVMHDNGLEVEPNRQTALQWWEKAADLGLEDARTKLEELGHGRPR
jgi:TPR repeat protein